MTASEERFRPDFMDAAAALKLLLWLFENSASGADRDEISHVRFLIEQEWPDV